MRPSFLTGRHRLAPRNAQERNEHPAKCPFPLHDIKCVKNGVSATGGWPALPLFLSSFIPAEFNAAEFLPGENDALGIEDGKLAGNEARVAEFSLRNLAFAT